MEVFYAFNDFEYRTCVPLFRVCLLTCANLQLAKARAERQEELWGLASSGGRALVSQVADSNNQQPAVSGTKENEPDYESVIMDWVQVLRDKNYQ